MEATDEAFKKKSEQMSTNRKSEVGSPGTSISLHSAGSISVRHHGDTLVELTRRLEEMSTHTPETLIDEDAAYLEVCAPVAFDIGVAYREGVDKDFFCWRKLGAIANQSQCLATDVVSRCSATELLQTMSLLTGQISDKLCLSLNINRSATAHVFAD
ncbi:hypothetical protein Syun_028043 [Stephania yunnanensis]|uniref:Uncharacterized protein n=1 Tax=Stephania yunnanensis TaxID=152371 RepID=A0AAP0HQH3_9MAGN